MIVDCDRYIKFYFEDKIFCGIVDCYQYGWYIEWYRSRTENFTLRTSLVVFNSIIFEIAGFDTLSKQLDMVKTIVGYSPKIDFHTSNLCFTKRSDIIKVLNFLDKRLSKRELNKTLLYLSKLNGIL